MTSGRARPPSARPSLAYTSAPAATDYRDAGRAERLDRRPLRADERATVVALPDGAPRTPRTAATGPTMQLVHVLIPADFRNVTPGGPPARFDYGWANLNATGWTASRSTSRR
jgi:hypothetical protein